MRPGASGTPSTILLVLIVLAAGGASALWIRLRREDLGANERAASAYLYRLTTAEADFRSNDRDGNRINDFWTGDVAGLFHLPDPGTPGGSIKLIEPRVAGADGAPRIRSGPVIPYHGYFFVAMDTDEEGNPYRQDTEGKGTAARKERNVSKFAFCAYPAEYGRTGRATYIINEWNSIFSIRNGGKPVLRFPTDDMLKQFYGKPGG